MPRPRKPPRLFLRRDERVWVILDGGTQVRTGCRSDERGKAEEALRDYLNNKASKTPVRADPNKTTLGEILARYVDDVGPEMKAPDRLIYGINALAPYWGNLKPDDVSIQRTREYERIRCVSASTVRRELGVLQAALNHAENAMHLANPPQLKLPKKAPPRERWLTLDEVERLLRLAPDHLARFVQISLVTGRRMRAVLNLKWSEHDGGGWIDLDQGIIHFNGKGEAESKKKKGSVRMTTDLLAAARKWREDGLESVIHFNGKAINDIGTCFDRACVKARLKDVCPHTLKHTAVTWAFQGGMTLEDASSYFATSVQTLLETYRKHSPHHNERAVSVMERVGQSIFADNVANEDRDRIAAE